MGGSDYRTIPWPYTAPVIGGVSEGSKYIKSINDIMGSGKIGDTDIIDEIFLYQARENNEIDEKTPIISLACAHPCKFPDAVYKSIKVKPSLPDGSKDLLSRKRKSLFAPADHSTVKSIIEGYRRL